MKRSIFCIQGVFAAAVVVLVASGVASWPAPGWAAVGKVSSRNGLAPWQQCLRASGSNKAIARRGGSPDWEANIVVCKVAVLVETEVPKVSFSLGALARAYAGTGQLDVAISLYQKAIRLMPDVDLHFSLAEVYRVKGLPAEAIAVYEEIARIEPGNVTAHLSLGKTYRAQGKWDSAIASYREAIRLQPDSAESHYGLGEAYRTKGLLDDAVDAYREAIRLQPDMPEAHYGLGRIYKQKGRLKAAIASYRKAIRLRPGLAGAHHSLGLAYEERGQWDAAVASYQEAIHLGPDLADAYYHIGVVYSINEHRALADHYLYEAASLYLTQGNREGALEAYGHLRSLNSTLAEKVYKRLYP